MLCRECRGRISVIREPRCRKCGKQLRKEEEEYCFDCRTKKHFFDKGMALLPYHQAAASIYRFKYGGRVEYAEFYADEIVKHFKEEILVLEAEALIPVPLHQKRQRKRGYNQSAVLAEELSKRLRIPVRGELVRRQKNTIPQKMLDESERQNNLKKAFKICQNDVKLKTVIIIDDIYTTGSTIDAMTRELKKLGIEKVYFIALAIGDSPLNGR